MDDSLISLTQIKAYAYVLRGYWVASCPRDECTNAEFVDARQHPPQRRNLLQSTRDMFHCTYCKLVVPLVWPSNADELMEPLTRRPIPHTRNWYPKNHPDAVSFGIEHGQSTDDLWAENLQHGVE